MKLRKIKINNFKSIEDAVVEDIGDIDILSGRNNSGKSAIFQALTTLRACSIYPTIQFTDLSTNIFTAKNFKERIMEITLVFELDDSERSNMIKGYGASIDPSSLNSLLKKGAFKQIEYSFRSVIGTTRFGLYDIKILSTDNKLSTVAERVNEEMFHLTLIDDIIKQSQPLTLETFKANRGEFTRNIGDKRPTLAPVFKHFKDCLELIYDFSPFRKSQSRMEATTTEKLSNDGSNLVQRIYTIKQNEDENWKSIQEFVKTALPDLGELQSRSIGKDTYTVFKDKKWDIEIDIHDMGSGIEQLLMTACVLISSSQNSLILMETPEHHLHPGAQRVLLQFIQDNLKNNQVLIATHSPIFLSKRELSMHLVTKTDEGTKIRKVEELEELSQALSELGSRNSDLLLADFVLFVEGTSDERIIRAWAMKLDVDFDSKNVVCVTIGGSRNFEYYAKSDVLEKVSSRSPIPYFFVIDRDEKSEDTINKIKRQVKNILILERREIENYLLLPPHILQTLRTKAESNKEILEKLQSVEPKDISDLIISKANKLKTLTLMKRIREEIGGGTFLSDNELDDLIIEVEGAETSVIVEKIYSKVSKTINEKCSKDKIRDIVKKQTSFIEKVWSEGLMEEIKKIVPGEEILKGIFEDFGLKYDKIKDGERIARKMEENEIPVEIKRIIQTIIL